MIFKVMTLFPEMFEGFKSTSMIGRAVKEGVLSIDAINFREFSDSKHRQVDDAPFGGGAGMVIRPQPLADCLKAQSLSDNAKVIYMTPKGKVFDQKMAIEFSKASELVFVCGHYEGIDQRFIDKYVTDEVSIGDYVLTGGELPAMVVMDAVARMVEGVLGKSVSYEEESHYNHLLEYPHYTRPAVFEEMTVPEVLMSGNHAKIEEWRLEASLHLTGQRRPDMLQKYDYSHFSKRKRERILGIIKKYCDNK